LETTIAPALALIAYPAAFSTATGGETTPVEFATCSRS
jgi:hypothetical protein